MKAAEVRILKALDPGKSYVELKFVLVETTIDRQGEALTTIEHLTSYTLRGRPRWKIVTLGQSAPPSHASALEWAVSFAASRNIPVVYQRDDSVGSGSYAAALSVRGSPAAVSAAK